MPHLVYRICFYWPADKWAGRVRPKSDLSKVAPEILSIFSPSTGLLINQYAKKKGENKSN